MKRDKIIEIFEKWQDYVIDPDVYNEITDQILAVDQDPHKSESQNERIIAKLKEIIIHVGIDSEGKDIIQGLRDSHCVECVRFADELAAIESEKEHQNVKSAEAIQYFINTIYDKIREDLHNARLSRIHTDDGDEYPLLDQLSSGNDISTGIEEIDYIIEQIDIEQLLNKYAQFTQQRQVSDELCKCKTPNKKPQSNFCTDCNKHTY